IQTSADGKARKIESNSIMEERISMMLRTSPVKTNSPLRRSKPAQNNVRDINGGIPKISIKKTIEETKSIIPSILTSIEKQENRSLRRLLLFIMCSKYL